ncbi:hypothetical protein DQ04_01731020 [Trypanosoma grayi]|uniref:hypothetical protein n=1 Tax=Trypanosoma grayi TaxID=71804 RepID=UPI0004F43089|nr:hypothetical protein DQ04_01731020 [Trypanosoma grayi]KEG12414.1 hypothetical protein DQ04_01731020 [Trypanosoma grayi]
MIRRFGAAAASSRSTPRALVPTTNCSTVREFHSVLGVLSSLVMCTGCVLCFGSWANNICNVQKYGRWRFRNSIDDVIMVSDFKSARYIGGLIGFLFYWFIVGPKKYRYDSNLAEVPGNKRFGPF